MSPSEKYFGRCDVCGKSLLLENEDATMGTYGHQGGAAFNEDQRGGHHPGVHELRSEIERLTKLRKEDSRLYIKAISDLSDSRDEIARLTQRLAVAEAEIAKLNDECGGRALIAMDLREDLKQAEALLREAVEVAWCDSLDEWYGNDIEDDWFERAKKACHDTI
jgi:DNA repair exonuclease SbcCD ATPase subunit